MDKLNFMKPEPIKRIVRIALLFCFWGISCSDSQGEGSDGSTLPESPAIEIHNPDIILEEYANSVSTVSFTSTRSWTVELSDSRAIPEWLEVSPAKGEPGKNTLSVKAREANPGYDDRCAYIRIRADETVKLVNVIQKKKNAIIAGKEKIILQQPGGKFSVPVKSNVEYQIRIPAQTARWIQQETSANSKSLNEITEKFIAQANTSDTGREGEIIFTNGTLADTVKIYQTQKNTLILTPKYKQIPATDHSFTVELQTNTEYDILIPPGVKWLRPIESKSPRTDRITFQAEANTSPARRTVKVTFKDLHSNLSDTLTVQQAEAGTVTLPLKEWNIGTDGGYIDIPLQSNVEYDVVIPSGASWIHKVDSRTVQTRQVRLLVDKNLTYNYREGKVVFRANPGTRSPGSSDTLTIRQAQKNAIILMQTHYTIGANGGKIGLTIQSNIDYTIIIPTSASWVHNTATRGLTTDHISLDIDPNPGNEKRNAQIYFRANTSAFADTLFLTQEAPDILFLSRNQQTLEAAGGDIDVSVTANTGYSVRMPAGIAWITEISSRALNSYEHKFRITPNTGRDARIAEIKFENQSGSRVAVLTVTQKAKPAVVPVLTTSAIRYLSLSQVQTGGTIISDGGAEITAKGVCWSTSRNPVIANQKTNDGYGNSDFISTINEGSRQTFYVRAYATNSAGTGYGNEMVFTGGSMTDIDGNVYTTVRIGNQIWMASNLKTTRYSNGDPIKRVMDATAWYKLSEEGAYCETDVNRYGRLYNWYAGKDWRNICPYGWHVPTSDEMRTMVYAVGNYSGYKLKEPGYWNYFQSITMTNETGFSGRGNGYRVDDKKAEYAEIGKRGSWWTCSKGMINFSTYGMSLELYYDSNYANVTHFGFGTGKAIRCVKD